MKKCTKCNKEKPVSQFGIRYRNYKSGRTKVIHSRCRACCAEESKQWRDDRRKEGKLSEINKRHHENRLKNNPENYRKNKKKYYHAYKARNGDEIRRKNREKANLKRRREGRPVRGPWKKYREKPSRAKILPIEPLQEYLREKQKDISLSQIASYAEMDKTVLEKILRGTEYRRGGKEYKKNSVTEETVDRILLGMHESYMFNELYPPDGG